MDGELEKALRELAGRQHGLVSRRQARRLGASRKALARRLRGPGWEPAGPQVLRLSGAPTTWTQRCMAAALEAGPEAAISREAAATLWALPGFKQGPVHVTKPTRTTSRPGSLGRTHESRYFPPHHHTLVGNVPVTTVARTVFDLAGCLHPLRAERTLDNALARNLVDLTALRAMAIELFEHGRTGSALMRRLLDDRGVGYIPPASGLEARFLSVVVGAGLEVPERQVNLGGGAWEGRVDFYYRLQRLVVEIDSDLHHTSKLDVEADARRDAALRAAGFGVLRVCEDQLKHRPWEVVALIRAALDEAAPAEPPPLLTPETCPSGPPSGVRTGSGSGSGSEELDVAEGERPARQLRNLG